VVLTGHVPLQARTQSITASPGGFCSQFQGFANSTLISCKLNVLPHGQTWTITIGVVTNAATAKAAARITFNGSDPYRTNNYSLVIMQNSSVAATTSTTNSPAKVPGSIPGSLKYPIAILQAPEQTGDAEEQKHTDVHEQIPQPN
jgi:hypothetical protein